MSNRVIDLAMDPGVQGVAWRKSRHSMNGGNCVEAAEVPDGIVVRDSANEAGTMLRYSTQTWRAFLAKAKIGKFDVKTELTGAAVNIPWRESDFRAVKV